MTITSSIRPPRARSHPETPQPVTTRIRRLLSEEASTVALLLGALSIVVFWTFGFGIILGAGAITAGVYAVRHPAIASSESKSLEALIGILTGAFGINIGIFFALAAFPQL